MTPRLGEWYEVPCSKCRLRFPWYDGVPLPTVLCAPCLGEVVAAAARKAKRDARTPEEVEKARKRSAAAKRYRKRIEAEEDERHHGAFLRNTEVGRALVAHGERPKGLWVRAINICLNEGIETADDLLAANPLSLPNMGKATLRYLYDALKLPYTRQLVVSHRRMMVEGDL